MFQIEKLSKASGQLGNTVAPAPPPNLTIS